MAYRGSAVGFGSPTVLPDLVKAVPGPGEVPSGSVDSVPDSEGTEAGSPNSLVVSPYRAAREAGEYRSQPIPAGLVHLDARSLG